MNETEIESVILMIANMISDDEAIVGCEFFAGQEYCRGVECEDCPFLLK